MFIILTVKSELGQVFNYLLGPINTIFSSPDLIINIHSFFTVLHINYFTKPGSALFEKKLLVLNQTIFRNEETNFTEIF